MHSHSEEQSGYKLDTAGLHEDKLAIQHQQQQKLQLQEEKEEEKKKQEEQEEHEQKEKQEGREDGEEQEQECKNGQGDWGNLSTRRTKGQKGLEDRKKTPDGRLERTGG